MDMLSFLGDYAAIAPLILLILSALMLPGVQLLGKNRTYTWAVAVLYAFISMVINFMMLSSGYTGDALGLFEYNAYSGLLILLFNIVLVLALFVSNESVETTRFNTGAYYALITAAALGMMFVVLSSDLLTIFVGVELTSISSYAAVSMKRNDPRAAEAAVKYVIVGGMSTALTLYGISMIYGLAGTTEIAALAAWVSNLPEVNLLLGIGIVAMVAGYGFKIAAVPFHMWAPDVYEGAATPLSMFLATGSKKMGLSVFFQIFLVMFIGVASISFLGETVQYLFAIIAAITMTVGNIVAIAQNNIKRMLAYSSVAQAGYILIVMAVMSEYALSSGLFHMFTHVFMKGGAFLIVGALICAGVGEMISDYKGLAKRSPFIAAAMMLFLFSLAGIPPLAGFTSKFFLFSATLYDPVAGADSTWVWLAFIAVLNSAISLYYYARVVKAMYIEKGESTEKIKIPRTFMIAIVICLLFVIVLGVYPQAIFTLCESAASALLMPYL